MKKTQLNRGNSNLKKTSLKKTSQKTRDGTIERIAYGYKMMEFFREIWSKRVHKSEVSGEFLFGEPRTYYFHHILPKSKYPEAEFDSSNIILLTFDEHQQVENQPNFYPEINKRREELLERYSNNIWDRYEETIERIEFENKFNKRFIN